MIRKVALVQALREAFPEDLGGMYSAEETNINEIELDSRPIELNGVQQAQIDPQTAEIVEADEIIVESENGAENVQQALFG